MYDKFLLNEMSCILLNKIYQTLSINSRPVFYGIESVMKQGTLRRRTSINEIIIFILYSDGAIPACR